MLASIALCLAGRPRRPPGRGPRYPQRQGRSVGPARSVPQPPVGAVRLLHRTTVRAGRTQALPPRPLAGGLSRHSPAPPRTARARIHRERPAPPPRLPSLQASPPTRAEAAAGGPAAAQAGPEAPTRCPLDHETPQHLAAADAAELKEIRTTCPRLDAAARRVHDFAEMLHHLSGDQNPDRMERVPADDLPALHSLVSGLRRDFDAVTAGLSPPWSSGQVEARSPVSNSSSARPVDEQTSTSYANAYSWAHNPATGTLR